MICKLDNAFTPSTFSYKDEAEKLKSLHMVKQKYGDKYGLIHGV